ncbi:GNAT family N-acetyltransferase [Spirosoma sp. KNUC1025]|uniref:GNAT family N-acetyltransferase n=1 Tax=Spirosoma sp. KNUC1025 TaxID=2894082 RepID=UPI00386E364A|nr:GNAT family N-acetyltransferase [Spirosoma sp. KNUC1025]
MIRPYTPSDLPFLMDLFRQNTPTYFAPEEEKDFLDYIHQDLACQLVSVDQGLIVGTAGYYFSPDETEGRISWVFFSPQAQGRGLGKALIEHCLVHINQKPTVEKIVVQTSQLAYQFFAKFGFTVVELKKDYWAKGLDLYRMEMKVST